MKPFLAITLLSISSLSAQVGKQEYLLCSACHAPDGKGTNNGQFPPLDGSEWLKGSPDRAIQVVLHGLQGPVKVTGKDYNLVMPPHGASMTDQQIANVLTYVRSSWSNKESAVTPEQVKAQRDAPGNPELMWNSADLLKKFPIPGQGVAEKKKVGALRDLLSYIHHGDFKTLADLRKSKSVNVEEEKGGLISLKHSDRKDKFGLVWEGWLDVPHDGRYHFYYDTDDGGAVTINGKELITRDRIGAAGKPTKKGINLKKGRADIKIEYFEFAGREQVSLIWDGPGVNKQALSETAGKQGQTYPSIPLTPPVNEATIYRNFIAGTDPRGIGVGYFEGVNLAFSADSMSMDLLWIGKFMDAGRHWTNRGQGFEGPAGEGVITVNRGVPVAILESQVAPWPAKTSDQLKPRFRGYQLDKKQQPTFFYEFGALQFSDKALPSSTGKGSFTRTINITVPAGKASAKDLYFRIFSGKPIAKISERSFAYEKYFIIDVPESEYAPFTRKNELLVPIPLNAGKHTLKINYTWK